MQRSDVEKIAHLARVEIKEADIPQYARNLTDILAFVEQMSEVDTDEVMPMAHPLDGAQRLRADVVLETDQHERFQALAPQVEAGLYLVPKVLE